MHISLDVIFGWLVQYGYFALFPIVVVEGPIITVIAGFLVGQGIFNPLVAYPIIIIADLVGDVLHYSIGRFARGKSLDRWRWIGVTEARVKKLEDLFERHPAKTLIFGKFSHGIGGVALVAAGAARMRITKFIWYNFWGTAVKSIILLGVGLEFGQAYKRIGKIFDYTAIGALIVVILLIAIYVIAGKLGKKLEHE